MVTPMQPHLRETHTLSTCKYQRSEHMTLAIQRRYAAFVVEYVSGVRCFWSAVLGAYGKGFRSLLRSRSDRRSNQIWTMGLFVHCCAAKQPPLFGNVYCSRFIIPIILSTIERQRGSMAHIPNSALPTTLQRQFLLKPLPRRSFSSFSTCRAKFSS